jgi:Holliday junction resolvase RusA-like endonuclease
LERCRAEGLSAAVPAEDGHGVWGGVMPYRFFVPGPLPGLNEIIKACKGYGGRGYGYSRLKKQWTDNVAWMARAAHLPRFTAIRLELLWVEPINKNGAKRDRDNIEAGVKFLADGLKAAGVIPDDRPENYLGASHDHDRGEKPGVWVTIKDAAGG